MKKFSVHCGRMFDGMFYISSLVVQHEVRVDGKQEVRGKSEK